MIYRIDHYDIDTEKIVYVSDIFMGGMPQSCMWELKDDENIKMFSVRFVNGYDLTFKHTDLKKLEQQRDYLILNWKKA